MKKILFLNVLNLNRRDGGALATLAYYNALCDLYPNRVDITVPEEDCKDRFCNAIPIPRRNFIDFIYPFSIHRGFRFLSKFIKKYHTDYSVCVVNNSRTAGDMMDIFKRYGLKTVVIHHNYEVEYMMSNKSIFTFKGLFPYLISKIEGNAYRKADINCFLTNEDMKLLHQEYGETQSKNYLLGVFEPNPISLKEPTIPSCRNCLVLTGSLCDYQTYHSIELFEKNYLHSMLKENPNIKIVMAGRNPHSSILNIRDKYPKTITVVPNPKDMDAVVEQANIFFCPTCIGGGLKLRLMDGLKLGLPVLVHKVSARGYDVFYDKPYFQVYDDVDSFLRGLQSISEFIKNTPNYKQEIQSTYCSYFSYESGLQRMNLIFSDLL